MKSLINAISRHFGVGLSARLPEEQTPLVSSPEALTEECPDWSALRPLLAGTAPASGGGKPVAVWRGEAILPAGMIIFRGCITIDAPQAKAHLTAPRFWSDDRELALGHAKWGGPSAAGKRGFLISARLAKPVLVADMAMYPIAERLYAAPRFFRIKDDHPQELQRKYSTLIARDYAKRDYDGVIDHGRREILLFDSASHIEISEIVEVPIVRRGVEQ